MARYKHQLDPTVEEVKKLCLGCRKNAKSERVLFHYNGHGVPKPTANGEIWVFNKSYTQYIPLPINPTNSKKDQGVQESYIAAHVIKISRFLFSTKKKDQQVLVICIHNRNSDRLTTEQKQQLLRSFCV
ncbi:hypothetical protein Sjap_001909 [Stephania japonica]|uniref:Raptor N-terminal CASPase-like domain-containing protein n=1 Tax=Stephania japonica TaxID=461633 RepID=A0AAP0KMM2_9MAGN